MASPIVFLDKDGTLVEDVPYSAAPEDLRLVAGAGDALRALHLAGWRLVVVTNQSGVARGYFPEPALLGVESRIRELLSRFGVPLSGFYYCPHHPEGVMPQYSSKCECRKPAPGLILAAAESLGVDPRLCWMIGDSPTDVEAGRRAGCRTILLSSKTNEGIAAAAVEPDNLASTLQEAAAIILGRAVSPSRTELPVA